MTDLFAPYQLGPLTLSNRLVMAPLTRNRAGEGEAPTALNAEYYAQRAAAGLIVTEGTQPSAVGQGYPHTPGLHTDAQEPAAVAVDALRRRVDLIFTARFVGDPAMLRPDDAEVTEICWRTPAEFGEVGPATVKVLDRLGRSQPGTTGLAWPSGSP